MEGGNEVNAANGITLPLEPRSNSMFLAGCEAARAVEQDYASEKAFLALPTSNQEPTLSVRDARTNRTRRCGGAEDVREVLKIMLLRDPESFLASSQYGCGFWIFAR